MDKPFAASAERNKVAILEALRVPLAHARRVLEIGSGTGQHGAFFARSLPHLEWQTSELGPRLEGVRAWTDEAGLDNLPPPILLDVSTLPWGCPRIDAIFSANTVHYMPWPAVERFFGGVDEVLGADGLFILYGPFNYGGAYSSEGNRQLDIWLAEQHPEFAIRDIEKLITLAKIHGFVLAEDCAMPANNRLLFWRRGTSAVS